MAALRPRPPSTWPDLPCDLLGVVLRGLPSLADRVRLRAVCRPWRLSAAPMLHQSPPQLPWLAFHDSTLLDVSNNTAHCVGLPDDGATSYCAGENMLFILHGDRRRCSLLNTFSSDVTPLPELAARLKAHGVESTMIMKVVVSSAPRLVAVLISSYGSSRVLASTCRLDGKIVSCQVLKSDRYRETILDIAIFRGKIHATTRDDKLFAVQLSDDEQRPRFRRRIICASLPPTPSPDIYEVRRYLVESHSMLLMVRRWVKKKRISETETAGWASKLSVVEADLSSGLWNKVDGLEGQALFVSRLCSKSVPAAAAGGHGAQQDCIYFLNEHGLGDSGVYNMVEGTITPLLPEEPATPLPRNSPCAYPAWFFPVEV